MFKINDNKFTQPQTILRTEEATVYFATHTQNKCRQKTSVQDWKNWNNCIFVCKEKHKKVQIARQNDRVKTINKSCTTVAQEKK